VTDGEAELPTSATKFWLSVSDGDDELFAMAVEGEDVRLHLQLLNRFKYLYIS